MWHAVKKLKQMKKETIKTLFLDIGGVLLTNGWDREEREMAVAQFNLYGEEVNKRHQGVFSVYEEGKMTLSEYLKQVVFYETRHFSEDDFIQFMYKQSQAYQSTIDFFKDIKKQFQLRVVALSNEGRELNDFRVKQFKLNELFDAFVVSSSVHLRKPDLDIFRLAMDIAQTTPEHSLYFDDRPMFAQVAQTLGMHGIHYQGLESAKIQMKAYGFVLEKKLRHA
jgi:putative hydrolase of the HAD superfamily